MLSTVPLATRGVHTAAAAAADDDDDDDDGGASILIRQSYLSAYITLMKAEADPKPYCEITLRDHHHRE